MVWVILEGLDRTGKSTVADGYKKQGYEVVHLSAPNKSYFEPGYTGPSYLDEMLDLVMLYDGKDVVFDRSWYGEFVWPHIYGRTALLKEEDLEIIEDYENRNSAMKILMVDQDVEAHWKRCEENNEPLDKRQFMAARRLFDNLAHKFNFMPRELSSFSFKDVGDDVDQQQDKQGEISSTDNSIKESDAPAQDSREDKASSRGVDTAVTAQVRDEEKTEEQKTLEKANAINSILSRRIIKQKGRIFDQIENDLKTFLNNQLKEIFSGKHNEYNSLSDDEMLVLKIYAQKILEKQKGTK